MDDAAARTDQTISSVYAVLSTWQKLVVIPWLYVILCAFVLLLFLLLLLFLIKADHNFGL